MKIKWSALFHSATINRLDFKNRRVDYGVQSQAPMQRCRGVELLQMVRGTATKKTGLWGTDPLKAEQICLSDTQRCLRFCT